MLHRRLAPSTRASLFYLAYLALGLDEAGPVERRHRAPLRSIAHDSLLVGVLVTTFLAASAVDMEFTFVGIYMSKLGGSGQLVGLLFAVAALFELPSKRYSGFLGERMRTQADHP